MIGIWFFIFATPSVFALFNGNKEYFKTESRYGLFQIA